MKCAIIGSSQYYPETFFEVMARLKDDGHEVQLPAFDNSCESQLEMCEHNRDLIEWADRVHIIWDQRSTGTILDFGMAVALHKKIVIEYLEPKTIGGIMQEYEASHICGLPASDFTCRDCDEPVCEDCCVPFTLQNQIDFTLCTSCDDGYKARRSMEYWKREEAQEKIDGERELKNKKRRERYRRPENVERRRKAREERKRAEAERRIKMFSETMKIVGGMFR